MEPIEPEIHPWEMSLKQLVDAWGEEILPSDITDSQRMFYLWDALARELENIKGLIQ